MVAPFVRPFGISAGSATILVFLESVFLSSLPTLALVATFVGPFIPFVAGGLSQRRARDLEDVQFVYDPLYTEILRNEAHILGDQKWGQMPMFQREKIDQLRLSARYSILKGQMPAVERFCDTMDSLSVNQSNTITAASRIIRETIQQNQGILGYEGDAIALRGKNEDGEAVNFSGPLWIAFKLVLGINPLVMFRDQGIHITSLDIIDKNSNVIGSAQIPAEEAKYRFLWERVEKRAKDDKQIMTVRSAFYELPTIVSAAKKEVLDKVKKSRNAFQ
jgi:hypothetical protein